jgi:DNA-directed RNA polymerase subunit L
MMERMWSVELNIDDKELNNCSWHIDKLNKTLKNNLRRYIYKEKVQRWVLIGICYSYEEAHKLTSELMDAIDTIRNEKGFEFQNGEQNDKS